MRRYSLLREVVRAFYSSSDKKESLRSASMVENQEFSFIRPLLPYSVRRFFTFRTSKASEINSFQPDLYKFIDEKTASQLWLN